MSSRLVIYGLLMAAGLATVGCQRDPPSNDAPESWTPPLAGEPHHPQVDFDKWASIFPIETFEKREGPRQYKSTRRGDPLDRWKAHGTAVTSPADLCHIELVRHRVAKTHHLGDPVPVDIVLWQTGPPARPYLTKLGGTPYRDFGKPWPASADGDLYTFVAQFCFLDSTDIVSEQLPGDVMLIFFKEPKSFFGAQQDVHIEWSRLDIEQPMTWDECPRPQFTVPQLSGVLYRCNEYPDSWDVFEQEGHSQSYLFPTTQSTKIGRETFYIQHDPRDYVGEEEGIQFQLLCVLNSLEPNKKWPFIDLPVLPEGSDKPGEHFPWGTYRMIFGDVGCMYFLIDDSGNVAWVTDCY